MAVFVKSFVAFLILSIATRGMCHCNYSNLVVGTERTGREIAGQPEWRVTVTNTCDCLQKHVTLSCGGFAPVNKVEPHLLLPQGDTCLLIKGEALPAKASAQFTYAGVPYIFRAIGSMVDLSCKD